MAAKARPWQMTRDDIALVAAGAAVLGSGGGGDPYLGYLAVDACLRDGRTITLLPLAAVGDDDLLVAVSQVGTALVSAEKLTSGTEVERAVRTVEHLTGRRAAAMLCDPIGGINSMIPLLAALQCRLPVVDADTAGRSFPEIQMTALDIAGLSMAPAAICDERGNVTALLDTQDAVWGERLTRALTTAMGGIAYLARPVRRGADVKRHAIGASYTRARAIGAALDRARREGLAAGDVLRPLGGRLLVRGLVASVDRRVAAGAPHGAVTVRGDNRTGRSNISIAFQNEYLVARDGPTVLATTPDIICLIDEETLDPVSTDVIDVGLSVAALAFPASAALTAPAALQVVGPAAFGYDVAYHAPGDGNGAAGDGADLRSLDRRTRVDGA